MFDAVKIFQGVVQNVCLIALLVIVVCAIAVFAAKNAIRMRDAMRKSDGLGKALFAVLGAVLVVYGATKVRTWKISFDAYVTNDNSYCTNDVVHLEFHKTSALVPDSANVIVYAKDFTITNGAEWVQLEPTIKVTDSPYEYSLANATNYDIMVTTDYIPQTPVSSNLLFQTTARPLFGSPAPQSRLDAVVPGSHFEDSAPKEPEPLTATTDGACRIDTLMDGGDGVWLYYGYEWKLTGRGLYASNAPEGAWTLSSFRVEIEGVTNVEYSVSYDGGPDFLDIYPQGDYKIDSGDHTNATLKVTATRGGEVETLSIPLQHYFVDDTEDM